jgi:hypothetical protein
MNKDVTRALSPFDAHVPVNTAGDGAHVETFIQVASRFRLKTACPGMNRRVRQLGKLRALSAAAAPALVVPGSARSGLTDVGVMNIRVLNPLQISGFSTHCKGRLLMQRCAGLVGSMGATLSLIVATSTPHTFRLNIQKGNSQ